MTSNLVTHLYHKGTKTHLLTEADPWSRIEREENEWVRNEVLFHPLIQETVGVEFQGYPVREVLLTPSTTLKDTALTVRPPQVSSTVHSEHRVYAPSASWDEERLTTAWCRPDYVFGRMPEVERPINDQLNPRVSGECAEKVTPGGII